MHNSNAELTSVSSPIEIKIFTEKDLVITKSIPFLNGKFYLKQTIPFLKKGNNVELDYTRKGVGVVAYLHYDGKRLSSALYSINSKGFGFGGNGAAEMIQFVRDSQKMAKWLGLSSVDVYGCSFANMELKSLLIKSMKFKPVTALEELDPALLQLRIPRLRPELVRTFSVNEDLSKTIRFYNIFMGIAK